MEIWYGTVYSGLGGARRANKCNPIIPFVDVCGIPDTADKKNNAGDSSLPPWQPAAVVQLVAPAKPAICVQKWC